MTNYELMLILNPTASDDAREKSMKDLKALLKTHKAKVGKEDIWGEKKLAYKINKSETGFYALLEVSIEGTELKKLTNPMNLNENIWRYMFVKIEEEKDTKTTTKSTCPLAEEAIDYKNVDLLRKYITKFGKIIPRYYSNVCLKNQKKLATAIKRARTMALIPFVKSFDPNHEG